MFVTELEDEILKSDWFVWQDPAKAQIHISIEPELTAKSFKILDAQGRVVRSGSVRDEMIISTAHWASGVYFVQLATDSRKLLVP